MRLTKAEQLANEMAECAEIRELTIVNRLIEKIEVSEPTTTDGEKVHYVPIKQGREKKRLCCRITTGCSGNGFF